MPARLATRRPVEAEAVGMESLKKTIDESIAVVRKALDATRLPTHPDSVPHSYEDKFRIVELVARASLATYLNTLAAGWGLSPEKLQQLQKLRGRKTVSLRFHVTAVCSPGETRTRDVKSDTRLEKQGVFGKTTYQAVHTVVERFWNYKVEWGIFAFVGAPESGPHIPLAGRTGHHVFMTHGKDDVDLFTTRRAFSTVDTEITWLLDAVKDGGRLEFNISRTDEGCHTPRRNPAIDGLLRNSHSFVGWARMVRDQLETAYRDGYKHALPNGEEKPNFTAIDSNVFVPVAVMLCLEESGLQLNEGGGEATESAATFSPSDFEKVMDLQQQQLDAKFELIRDVLQDEGIVTVAEAAAVVCAGYCVEVGRQLSSAVQAVEDMLMQQVIAAIGKKIGPKDFAKYMAFHNRRLYRPEYAPIGFSYAVRRPGHDPEGVLSIDDARDDNQPVPTTCRHIVHGHVMKIALGPSMQIPFHGEHFVHSVVFHRFSNGTGSGPKLHLVARARQFSSFILMVGGLNGADTFEPKHALIIQNKDELKIPLILETIPAPQEFRDAIESLSPEQQAFCKAYRQMQLAGTLFGVAIVQIKPALERLLGVPQGALTKEVELCQQLMSLFIEYQIPSDLMAYDGPENATEHTKVDSVRTSVAIIVSMLDKAKQAELEAERVKQEKILQERVARLARQKAQEAERPTDSWKRRGGRGGKRSEAKRGGLGFGWFSKGSLPTKARDAVKKKMKKKKSVINKPKTAVQSQQQSQQHSQQQSQQQQQQHEPHATSDTKAVTDPCNAVHPHEENVIDYTQLPSRLDANFDRFDAFNNLRATTIKAGLCWQKTAQAGLLSKPTTEWLKGDKQRTERCRAFDLLDALSKSAAIPLQGCSLHILLAATQSFDLDLLDTVVQDNINPIVRSEASGLIMAATIFDRAAEDLVVSANAERVAHACLSQRSAAASTDTQ